VGSHLVYCGKAQWSGMLLWNGGTYCIMAVGIMVVLSL
jgi:hypothetical protein